MARKKKKEEVLRNTSHPKQIQSEEDMFRYRGLTEEGLLKDVLSTFEGRHYLQSIIQFSGVEDDIETLDPALAQRLLGRRSVGLSIKHDIEAVAPEMLILMRQEQAAFEEKYTFVNQEEEDG